MSQDAVGDPPSRDYLTVAVFCCFAMAWLLRAQINGDTGIFPSNLVEVIVEP